MRLSVFQTSAQLGHQSEFTSDAIGALTAAINAIEENVFMPTIDDDFLPDLPSTLIASGNFSAIDFVGGHCADDGSIFVGGTPDQFVTDQDVMDIVFVKWGDGVVSWGLLFFIRHRFSLYFRQTLPDKQPWLSTQLQIPPTVLMPLNTIVQSPSLGTLSLPACESQSGHCRRISDSPSRFLSGTGSWPTLRSRREQRMFSRSSEPEQDDIRLVRAEP